MSLLEHPIVATLVGTLAAPVITAVGVWIWRKFFRPDIRIMTATEKGPVGRKLGFTEAHVKITLMNRSSKDIQIKDIRLMFCGAFGASVAPEAPAGRSHRGLPVSLAAGTDEIWYIPAEQLSSLLRRLYHPPSRAKSSLKEVELHARCITGTGKIYKGSPFSFPTDPDVHW